MTNDEIDDIEIWTTPVTVREVLLMQSIATQEGTPIDAISRIATLIKGRADISVEELGELTIDQLQTLAQRVVEAMQAAMKLWNIGQIFDEPLDPENPRS